MLAVEVRLLTDRYVATQFNERSVAEWPPHPARLFSAMVAAWAGSEDPSDATQEALAWFAALGAPAIACSPAHARTDVTHYVPVNDAAVVRDLSAQYDKLRAARAALDEALGEAQGDLDARGVRRAQNVVDQAEAKAVADSAKASQVGGTAAGLRVLPDERGRQGRSYPCVVPESDLVWFAWPEAEADPDTWQLLDDVLAEIARLGHSSSMVACRLVDTCPPPDLVPDPDASDAVLRVTGPGQLVALQRAFDQHLGREPRALPARMARYRRAAEPTPSASRSTLSGHWIVLSYDATPRLPGHRALVIAKAVRQALISHADEPVPEILSGHQVGEQGADTAPSTEPHLAVLPLPFVGAHGDGGVIGVALAMPSRVDPSDERAVLRAVGRWEQAGFELRLGALGVLRLRRVEPNEPGTTVDRHTWARPSRDWVTVSPIGLDRHPGDLWSRDSARREKAERLATESIRLACERVGLPRPDVVEISRDGLLRGADSIRHFSPYAAGNGPRRCLTHAALTFDEPVVGPLVLGAGRFLGYGLCRPRDAWSRSGG